ncbi:OOP family OmpA-OmpF porin [Flavobacterium arsenatis]|uniref:OOP family OmpA-OmpF porin n=1 Tax=Flavobacterium arsenatis TaxID=1484332 RepID=A0ABU1TT91_9FLAO|nr:OmpA family protein [Flavobacterium arsenatis]MDR6969101.1 OOP family OmpA-OmpF porin [Flavobacterium arsenatis]
MKKILLTLSVFALTTSVFAQTDEPTSVSTENSSDYNKWSIELNGGVNKFQRPATSGYFQSTPSPWNADFGVRYMFNNKFGLKLDAGYYSFTGKDESMDFDTHFYRANLQAVANVGRVLNFETWTNRLGLLAHGGFGYAQLKSDNHAFTDRMGNFMVGLTPQLRLSNRVALTGDFSTLLTVSQNKSFDGASDYTGRGFQGILFQGSIGLTVYLGGNEKHADWVTMDSELKKEIDALENRLATIETGLTDSDQDGVPDMFDAEPNSMAGVQVDTKGRTIDRNNNGVADELESYFETKYGDKGNTSTSGMDVKSLINDGYVNVYFDFNKTQPTTESASGINFLVKYLKANPSASADVVGYADEIGNADYNKNLSQQRAANVKQILVDAGISGSRLNVVANGEDTSVNKDSKQARQIVRRVTFKIK